MNSKLTLRNELRNLVEARMEQTLKGIEDTLHQIITKQEVSLKDLKEDVRSLEESFNLLSQKWNLEMLYTLFLRKAINFGELKKILGVNSRTLSDKLKTLREHGYINRIVEQGPPLRVKYSITIKGKNTVLLALPLLYYSRSVISPQTKTRNSDDS